MKLSNKALSLIKDSRTLPKKLGDALEVSRVTIWRYIKDNSDELTKAVVVKLLREETGLSDEEILEETESVRA